MIRPTFAEEFHSSEVKSLRRFLYDNFGGPSTDAPSNPPILVRRDDQVARPYWRILSSATVNLRREALAWDNGLRQYVVGYFDTDYDEVMRRIDALRARLQATSGIPYRVYDACWFRPKLRDLDIADGTFPAGGYSISCSVLIAQPDGSLAETLASDPVTISLDADTTLEVRVPTWPVWAPLAVKVRVYIAPIVDLIVGPRQFAAEEDAARIGWTPVVLNELPAEDADGEPAESTVWLGRMNVDQVSLSAFESSEKDGDFDGIATIYLARELPTADLAGWGVYAADQVTVFPPGSP